ncbi:MAG: WD40 repeat domain-containing protein [Gemmataceae bacterium]
MWGSVSTCQGQTCKATWKAHLSSVWSVKFSPNGKLLASTGLNKTIKMWDVGHENQQSYYR